ncbi:MAG: HDOD domain-containing protein [Phycisphaerales bacterium]|nr:HDOD domain-containing protein [Phycisphaerales bacterium]
MTDSLLQDVLSCSNLPSLPAVAVKLLELTSDPDVAMKDIAKLVQQDQALAAKVLKTVNSSFYGLSSRCGSIERAMGYLGLNTVKSLVLGFSLVETTKNAGEGFDLEAHWRRAIVGASGARKIAQVVGGVDPEEAFTAALFQDMGMLAAFAAMKTRYTETIDGVPHRVLCGLEKETFGFDHAKVGTGLAEKWKLPEEICEAIRCHHDPDDVLPSHESLARVVSLGAILTDAMDGKTAKSAIRKLERLTSLWYAKRAPDVESLIEEVAETSKTLAKMFDQNIGDFPDAAELMAQAQEQGIEHQVAQQRQAEELAKEASIDGLTRVANRKHFDIELDRVYNEYLRSNKGFGVLFFDADKFKNVNDTYGHAAGDAVLIELAKRTSDTIGDMGVVCRYGGEEFAIIVPNATLDECAMLGEQVCSVIDASPFDLSMIEGMPATLRVTVSVGVSSVDAGKPGRLASGDQIVQEADECVYAAKEDGRNNVKVYGRFGKKAEQTPAVSTPAAESVSTQESAPLTTRQPPTVAPAPTNKPKAVGRLMLVEDDALAATLVISLIKRRSKVDIQWVKSGTKACILLESGKFVGDDALDLIICDFNLPGCNGYEVLRVAKNSMTVADVPFYMLSGSTDADMKDESHRLGATQFIHKDEFCANVNKWIDEVLSSVQAAA